MCVYNMLAYEYLGWIRWFAILNQVNWKKRYSQNIAPSSILTDEEYLKVNKH